MKGNIPVKNITPVKTHQPDESQPSANYGSGSKIYVRAIHGHIELFRRFFGLFFVAAFALIPWLQFQHHQAVLLDLTQPRVDFFNLTLWPQDLTLLAWIFIVAAYGLFFITTFAGRVWCGFMCPQTVWTLTFIWFEELFEGNRNKRILLDKRPMDLDKFLRKTAKHTCWLLISLLTALTFVGYFTPIRPLFMDILTLQASTWVWISTLTFTFCTYGNAGWMREIMCTHICPYARFQSTMFDQDTLTVSYDADRGEPRGPRSRKMDEATRQAKNIGDCVDCNLCVQVCPTGIDIRDGLQYECINCGKCVDACNDTMEKMRYPKGLIRFTSENQLKGIHTRILRPKLIGYALVMVVMLGLLANELLTRAPLSVDIIRDRNSLYRENSQGLIENVYTLKILNKSQFDTHYHISVEGIDVRQISGPVDILVKKGEVIAQPLSIAVDAYAIKQAVTPITFLIRVSDGSDQGEQVKVATKFLYR